MGCVRDAPRVGHGGCALLQTGATTRQMAVRMPTYTNYAHSDKCVSVTFPRRRASAPARAHASWRCHLARASRRVLSRTVKTSRHARFSAYIFPALETFRLTFLRMRDICKIINVQRKDKAFMV